MNCYDRFEIKAAAFHRMMQMMAPGKDEPAACHGHDMSERIDTWDDWNTKHHDVIEAILWAVSQHYEQADQ